MTSTIILPRRSRVSLPVPSSYIGKQVEVRFFVREETSTPSQSAIQELILQSPTWTDKEYSEYLDAKKHINQSRLQ